MELRSCHCKCHRKNQATSKGFLHGGGEKWEDGLDADKLVWGLVRGSSEGARAHTGVHTRAHNGCGSPRRAGRGLRGCFPPLVTALAGWDGDWETVTGATSAAVTFPECHGS